MGDEEEIPADQIHIVAVAPGLIARSLFRELDIQLSKIQYQCTYALVPEYIYCQGLPCSIKKKIKHFCT